MSSAANMYVKLQKLTNKANKEEMAFNKVEAQTARDWQKMMSDTSHQRETADLINSGLNPVLSANSGAQSYTTSSASANVESAAPSVAGAFGAVTSASATRYAADRSYAASLAMANAQVESAKWSYKAQMDKPQTSIAGVIDKYLTKGSKFATQQAEQIINSSKSLQSVQQSKGKVSVKTISNYTLNKIDSALKSLGVHRITNAVRQDYLNFLTTQNSYYFREVLSQR